MITFHCFILITCVIFKVLAVPPSVCRTDFRWEDCGKPPKPVMYYWKQGSRCEVGIWKGCLPNPNMFNDEYECINTCVFQEKPIQRDDEPETETEVISTEASNVTDVGNVTDVSDITGGSGNDTSDATAASAATDSPDGNSTDSTADGTGATDADTSDATAAEETTAAEE